MVKKYRKDLEVTYTLGITLTIELLKERIDLVKRVFFHSKFEKKETYELIEEICNNNNIPLITNDKVFNILSNKENVYVIGEFIKENKKINVNSNHIVLVNPSNSGNLGTIIRSMIGFGLDNLAIINPAVDIYDPKTIRASMGAMFHMNFEYFNSFADYETSNKNHNIYPFMLKAKNNLANLEVREPYSLVFGNEATGLNDEFLKYENSVIIKHSNIIDSLNLPIACSLAIYEVTKGKFRK